MYIQHRKAIGAYPGVLEESSSLVCSDPALSLFDLIMALRLVTELP